MSDRPIIFSAPMVRALLDGRKTQTRRVLREDKCGAPIMPAVEADRLWVREAWKAHHEYDGAKPIGIPPGDYGDIWYAADGPVEPVWLGRGRSPIHMPRWASRLTLTVTDVRVQRLQEISEADAVAEGVERLQGSKGPNHFTREITGKWSGSFNAPTAQEVFRDLWNSLHGPGAWDANPWVAAISFDVHCCNIDSLRAKE